MAHNFFDTMEKVSGIPKEEQMGILDEVKTNIQSLNSCVKPHDFKVVDEEKLFSKYKCIKCGGTVDHMQAMWYQRGLKDATDLCNDQIAGCLI
jgi:hypothetical protein